jgi:hypothetical protein
MRARIVGRFAAASDFDLEAYLCDELPPERRREIERAALLDAGLHEYLAHRRAARARFAVEHPLRLPPGGWAPPDARAARPAPLRWLVAAAVAAPALALGLALVVWGREGPSASAGRGSSADERGRDARDTVRVKGNGLSAELYVKRGERVFRPQRDERLRAGDRVRLSVETARAGYLTLLARDDRGTVSVYYNRLPVQPGRFIAPDSLLLDDSASDEVWLVLVSSEPRSSQDLAQAFAAGRAPNAPHVSFTLRKEKP